MTTNSPFPHIPGGDISNKIPTQFPPLPTLPLLLSFPPLPPLSLPDTLASDNFKYSF
jgi:hypothetical protein